MSQQGWGLQSRAPDCLGCSWLGPSGTPVLSALGLLLPFCSLMRWLHHTAHQLLCVLQSPLEGSIPELADLPEPRTPLLCVCRFLANSTDGEKGCLGLLGGRVTYPLLFALQNLIMFPSWSQTCLCSTLTIPLPQSPECCDNRFVPLQSGKSLNFQLQLAGVVETFWLYRNCQISFFAPRLFGSFVRVLAPESLGLF